MMPFIEEEALPDSREGLSVNPGRTSGRKRIDAGNVIFKLINITILPPPEFERQEIEWGKINTDLQIAADGSQGEPQFLTLQVFIDPQAHAPRGCVNPSSLNRGRSRTDIRSGASTFMKFITKSLLALALSGAVSMALAAEVQKVSVATASGQDAEITTQDDGTLAVSVGGQVLTGDAATAFLTKEGVGLSVSPTGMIMGVNFANGGRVTQKPVTVARPADAARPARLSSVMLPPNEAAGSAAQAAGIIRMTEQRIDERTISN